MVETANIKIKMEIKTKQNKASKYYPIFKSLNDCLTFLLLYLGLEIEFKY